jgi:hypothetical protein
VPIAVSARARAVEVIFAKSRNAAADGQSGWPRLFLQPTKLVQQIAEAENQAPLEYHSSRRLAFCGTNWLQGSARVVAAGKLTLVGVLRCRRVREKR